MVQQIDVIRHGGKPAEKPINRSPNEKKDAPASRSRRTPHDGGCRLRRRATGHDYRRRRIAPKSHAKHPKPTQTYYTMKKALLLLAAAAACAIALPATAARNKTLKGSGRIVTETRDVGSFHAVEAGSIAHVLVGDYPAGRVTVKTDDNLLVHVQTSVAEGTLRIGLADVTVQKRRIDRLCSGRRYHTTRRQRHRCIFARNTADRNYRIKKPAEPPKSRPNTRCKPMTPRSRPAARHTSPSRR